MITVRNKFNTPLEIYETLTLNDKYENFKAYIVAAAECIPTKPTAKQRVLRETLGVIKKMR